MIVKKFKLGIIAGKVCGYLYIAFGFGDFDLILNFLNELYCVECDFVNHFLGC